MLKRISIILLVALALTFAFSGVAYANFGPHGGYTEDTDACAGCHRAHTSFSTVTWEDRFGGTGSALLIGSATTMEDFCNACHGADAPGASTNVVEGVFDSGPSGADTQIVGDDNDGVVVAYETNSTFGGVLNGGGFYSMPEASGSTTMVASSSSHGMEATSQPLWGDNDTMLNNTWDLLTCTSCHDPHGSSNYRLLKDSVNGNTVGGYDLADNPLPFVVSAEEGYPLSGWFKHEAGATQVSGYYPDYTTSQYRNTGLARENISGWCSSCHERYIVRNDETAVSAWGGSGRGEFDDITTNPYDYDSFLADMDSPAQVGSQIFHRHPMNVTLAAGDPNGLYWLNTPVTTDSVLPLEFDGSGDIAAFRAGEWDYTDYLGCLTCHRAHGTAVTMEGWAEAALDTTNGTDWYPVRTPGSGGVDPVFDSALLRADNRGVCERCHNK